MKSKLLIAIFAAFTILSLSACANQEMETDNIVESTEVIETSEESSPIEESTSEEVVTEEESTEETTTETTVTTEEETTEEIVEPETTEPEGAASDVMESETSPSEAPQVQTSSTRNPNPKNTVAPAGYVEPVIITNENGDIAYNHMYDSDGIVNQMRQFCPDGTPWGAERVYQWRGKTSGDGFGTEYVACGAFAMMMSDAVYGDLPATKHFSGELHVYDVVMINPEKTGGQAHWGFVTAISEDGQTITTADGNVTINGGSPVVKWDNTWNVSDIQGFITRG